MGGPGRLILHQHEALEGRQIASDRAVGRPGIGSGDIRRDRRERCAGGSVASQGLQHPVYVLRIVPYAVYARNIDTAHFRQIVPVGEPGFIGRGEEVSRPATDTEDLRHLTGREMSRRTSDAPTPENSTERYRACGVPQFGQGHGPQAQPAEATRAGMARYGIGRHRGTGEDELCLGLAIVDCPAYMVPEVGLQLPFVDQAGRSTCQELGRLEPCEAASFVVYIEKDFAASNLASSPCLATSSGALDDYCPRRCQAATQFSIHDPRSVASRASLPLGTGRQDFPAVGGFGVPGIFEITSHGIGASKA